MTAGPDSNRILAYGVAATVILVLLALAIDSSTWVFVAIVAAWALVLLVAWWAE